MKKARVLVDVPFHKPGGKHGDLEVMRAGILVGLTTMSELYDTTTDRNIAVWAGHKLRTGGDDSIVIWRGQPRLVKMGVDVEPYNPKTMLPAQPMVDETYATQPVAAKAPTAPSVAVSGHDKPNTLSSEAEAVVRLAAPRKPPKPTHRQPTAPKKPPRPKKARRKKKAVVDDGQGSLF